MNLDVERLTGTIGAVVSGLELGQPQPEESMRAIEEALHTHGVLFFPDQHLDFESHIAIGRWFGPLDVHHSNRNQPGHPEIYVLEGYSRDIEWHADTTFLECPARASVLRAVSIPHTGGDTIWSSTCAAYDALSPAIQRLLDELHAVHDSRNLNNRDPHLEIKTAIHPVVIDHPWTGRRAVFVNPMFTRRILELSEAESNRILRLVFDQIQRPAHHVRWRWKANTVAIWDNFATQHCVIVDYTEPRLVNRVTVQGPRPTSHTTNQNTELASSGASKVLS